VTARNHYLVTGFVWGALFAMMTTAFMVYQVEMAGLGPLQLVLVGTALEIGAFLFEIPTGVVADAWSRKGSVVVGFLIIGVAFVISGLNPRFEIIALSSFGWGIGWTFISGAKEAWLADEVGVEVSAGLMLKGARLGSMGSFVGIVLAVVIGSVQINYPVVLSGVLFALWGVISVILMPETNFQPSNSAQGRGQQMATIFAAGVRTVRGNRVLLMLLAVGVVFGAFSEGYDRLSSAHVLRSFDFPEWWDLQPVVWFGAVAALGSLLGIGAVGLVERHVDTGKAAEIGATLSVVTGGVMTATLLFAWSFDFWLAMLVMVLMQPLRLVVGPLETAWINKNVGSDVRATVISMHGQSDAFGQIAGGPGVGLIGRALGIPIAITVSAFMLAPAIFLYRRSVRVAKAD
jgi:DHA3 family tetracycline resistance protein-like MFS transporter